MGFYGIHKIVHTLLFLVATLVLSVYVLFGLFGNGTAVILLGLRSKSLLLGLLLLLFTLLCFCFYCSCSCN